MKCRLALLYIKFSYLHVSVLEFFKKVKIYVLISSHISI